MTKARSSRAAYEARLHRVLEYIDAHIAETLDLETLAKVASFSAFHFHRLFAAWTGERLGEYVRRRRLELAASRLVSQPALEVFDVAVGVGFGSAEAFSRAFKTHFGSAPGTWRKQALLRKTQVGNPDQAKSNSSHPGFGYRGDHVASTQPAPEEQMKVRLETLPPVHVACLRYVGPYGEALESFWKETVYPWMVANGLQDAERYGISHDDPSITAADKCRYDACVVVARDSVLTGGALKTILPGGRYAVQDFTGTIAEIADAWSAVLRDWLPDSGLQLDGRPAFEHYPAEASYDADRGIFECRICVPVAPL